MEKLPRMMSMARTPAEMAEEAPMAIMAQRVPVYPYGLSLSFDDETMAKLDIDDDCEVGDIVHFFALARVTAVSANETSDGKRMRVELQITDMSVESEDDENAEMEQQE